MKVNIAGVGLIPRVGLLAPVYGKDLTKDTVKVILGYSSFRVYVAATGVRITKKNIDAIFGADVKKTIATPSTAVVVESVKKTATVKKSSKKEKIEPVVEVEEEQPVEIEQVDEPITFSDEVADVVASTASEEVPEDEGFPVDDIIDEDTPAEDDVVEEKPVYTNNKKKKRR